MDLVKYMQGQYSNAPEELYEGCKKGWEKVMWEEEEALENAKGPGPEQGKEQPGGADDLSAEPGESPISLEDAAQQPRSGPRQVRL